MTTRKWSTSSPAGKPLTGWASARANDEDEEEAFLDSTQQSYHSLLPICLFGRLISYNLSQRSEGERQQQTRFVATDRR
jgi:hypothetical protein